MRTLIQLAVLAMLFPFFRWIEFLVDHPEWMFPGIAATAAALWRGRPTKERL